MNKGYIKLHRKIKDNWLFKNPEYFKAWIDMILTANYNDGKVVIGQTIFICKRGQSLLSIKSWANKWNWSYSKVRRFFNMLTKESMIRIANESQTTRLTIINYDSYQDVRHADEKQMKSKRKADEKQMKTIKESIKENKTNKNVIYSISFEQFWKVYPRKIAKDLAHKKWIKLKPDIKQVLQSIQKYKETEQWADIKFIPHPATWLNQRRWEDTIDIDETRKLDISNWTTPTPVQKLEPEVELTKEEEAEIEIEKKKLLKTMEDLRKGMSV